MEARLYLDASILVALLTEDAPQVRAETILRSTRPEIVVSDFASAEFSSVMAKRVRTREVTADQARLAFSALDIWIARFTERVETAASDIKVAEALVRRLDCPLRAPDALNLAISQRAGAALGTFDVQLAAAARALGAAVVDGS